MFPPITGNLQKIKIDEKLTIFENFDRKKFLQLFHITVESYEPFWRTTRLRDYVVEKVEHYYDFGTKPSSPFLVRFNCI